MLKVRDAGLTNAIEIINCAGGRIVGRTRLQKIAYLLEITGEGSGFKVSVWSGPFLWLGVSVMYPHNAVWVHKL